MFLSFTDANEDEPVKIHCNMLHVTHMKDLIDLDDEVPFTEITFVGGNTVCVAETTDTIFDMMRKYKP